MPLMAASAVAEVPALLCPGSLHPVPQPCRPPSTEVKVRGTCSTAPGPLLRGGWGGCYVEVGSRLFPAPEHLLRAGLFRGCVCGHVPAAAGGVRVQSPDLSPEVRVSFCLSAAPRPQMWGTAPSLHPRSSRLPSPSTLGWRRGLSGLQDACAPVARAWLPGGLHLLRLGVGFFRGVTST